MQNSAAASISMLFIVVAIIFGLIQKKVGKMKEWVRAVVAIGTFGCNVCHRYASSNVCNKDNMDLRRYGLPVPCIGYANVAFDGAS